MREWASTAHTRAGVNCTACHEIPDGRAGTRAWQDRPGSASCGGCHGGERDGCLRGQHGSPLTPATARLPMKAGAAGKALDCDACHGAHAYDTARAAADACLGCHDDRHSRGFAATRHAEAFARERRGEAAPGTGV